jgi:hypothetical protein
MYKNIFSTSLLVFVSIMLLFPQLGSTEESLNKVTDNKKFQVEVTLPGDGFKVGINDLSLKVTDAKGKAVEGAIISITPWMTMPNMEHGVMLSPEVKETSKGTYAAKNVGFSMPGKWQLIVTINKKDIDDRATFDFANIGGATVAKTEAYCGWNWW